MVVVRYAGQAVEAASTRVLFERPGHPFTRGLLLCLPTPGILGRHARLGTIPGMVPTPIGLPPQCGFANRCPQATPLCTAGDIPLTAVATGHESRCLLAGRDDEAKAFRARQAGSARRSEEHTSELPSLMRNSYAVFCLKQKN